MPITDLDRRPIEHEPESLHNLVVVHDGSCTHNYVDHHVDQETGLMTARCSLCPHGTAYNPETHFLVDGQIEKYTDKRIS